MSGVLVTASRSAVEAAHRAGFTGILETATERAICAGRKFRSPVLDPESRFVELLDADLVVLVKRDGRTPQGRRRWVALRVDARRNGRRRAA